MKSVQKYVNYIKNCKSCNRVSITAPDEGLCQGCWEDKHEWKGGFKFISWEEED
tara:strand:- start:190 stop:351 length:162 start_codon:yes stop_codon:yes gene_type:complete